MPRKFIILTAGLALGGLCLISFLRHRASSPADQHIEALVELRYPPRDTSPRRYFSIDYLLWCLQGRHNHSQVNQLKSQHWESLVASGYLQRRVFPLKQRSLENDPMQLQVLQSLHCKACEAAGLGFPLVRFSIDWSNTVTITARPSEVKVFERVLRRFDSTNVDLSSEVFANVTNISPNPQGGANGRQPFGSGTNQTPPAAAVRRSP